MKHRTLPAMAPASDRIVSGEDNLITTTQLVGNHLLLEAAVKRFEALATPKKIDDDTVCGHWQDHIKAIDDFLKHNESTRVAEKAPFLAAERTVDGFFRGLESRAGAALMPIRRAVADYLNRKAIAERAKREEKARKARAAEEAKRLEAEASRKREENAKRAETQAKHRIAAREAEQTAEQLAQRAAAFEAPAKSADLARTRSTEGSLGTLKDKWDFTIEDIDAVKGARLWAYVTRDAKEQAIRAYIRANAPKQLGEGETWSPIEGIEFFLTSKLQVR